ncbi:hypothetical protein TWF730_006110 [Orbilia blumenaviensis]|uniref:Uncharacterized protein n=1 Tax=Orbilia blumenaviensis TaxID=1796055 RepID=A0AAV9TWN8_9PEZI
MDIDGTTPQRQLAPNISRNNKPAYQVPNIPSDSFPFTIGFAAPSSRPVSGARPSLLLKNTALPKYSFKSLHRQPINPEAIELTSMGLRRVKEVITPSESEEIEEEGGEEEREEKVESVDSTRVEPPTSKMTEGWGDSDWGKSENDSSCSNDDDDEGEEDDENDETDDEDEDKDAIAEPDTRHHQTDLRVYKQWYHYFGTGKVDDTGAGPADEKGPIPTGSPPIPIPPLRDPTKPDGSMFAQSVSISSADHNRGPESQRPFDHYAVNEANRRILDMVTGPGGAAQGLRQIRHWGDLSSQLALNIHRPPDAPIIQGRHSLWVQRTNASSGMFLRKEAVDQCPECVGALPVPAARQTSARYRLCPHWREVTGEGYMEAAFAFGGAQNCPFCGKARGTQGTAHADVCPFKINGVDGDGAALVRPDFEDGFAADPNFAKLHGDPRAFDGVEPIVRNLSEPPPEGLDFGIVDEGGAGEGGGGGGPGGGGGGGLGGSTSHDSDQDDSGADEDTWKPGDAPPYIPPPPSGPKAPEIPMTPTEPKRPKLPGRRKKPNIPEEPSTGTSTGVEDGKGTATSISGEGDDKKGKGGKGGKKGKDGEGDDGKYGEEGDVKKKGDDDSKKKGDDDGKKKGDDGKKKGDDKKKADDKMKAGDDKKKGDGDGKKPDVVIGPTGSGGYMPAGFLRRLVATDYKISGQHVYQRTNILKSARSSGVKSTDLATSCHAHYTRGIRDIQEPTKDNRKCIEDIRVTIETKNLPRPFWEPNSYIAPTTKPADGDSDFKIRLPDGVLENGAAARGELGKPDPVPAPPSDSGSDPDWTGPRRHLQLGNEAWFRSRFSGDKTAYDKWRNNASEVNFADLQKAAPVDTTVPGHPTQFYITDMLPGVNWYGDTGKMISKSDGKPLGLPPPPGPDGKLPGTGGDPTLPGTEMPGPDGDGDDDGGGDGVGGGGGGKGEGKDGDKDEEEKEKDEDKEKKKDDDEVEDKKDDKDKKVTAAVDSNGKPIIDLTGKTTEEIGKAIKKYLEVTLPVAGTRSDGSKRSNQKRCLHCGKMTTRLGEAKAHVHYGRCWPDWAGPGTGDGSDGTTGDGTGGGTGGTGDTGDTGDGGDGKAPDATDKGTRATKPNRSNSSRFQPQTPDMSQKRKLWETDAGYATDSDDERDFEPRKKKKQNKEGGDNVDDDIGEPRDLGNTFIVSSQADSVFLSNKRKERVKKAKKKTYKTPEFLPSDTPQAEAEALTPGQLDTQISKAPGFPRPAQDRSLENIGQEQQGSQNGEFENTESKALASSAQGSNSEPAPAPSSSRKRRQPSTCLRATTMAPTLPSENLISTHKSKARFKSFVPASATKVTTATKLVVSKTSTYKSKDGKDVAFEERTFTQTTRGKTPKVFTEVIESIREPGQKQALVRLYRFGESEETGLGTPSKKRKIEYDGRVTGKEKAHVREEEDEEEGDDESSDSGSDESTEEPIEGESDSGEDVSGTVKEEQGEPAEEENNEEERDVKLPTLRKQAPTSSRRIPKESMEPKTPSRRSLRIISNNAKESLPEEEEEDQRKEIKTPARIKKVMIKTPGTTGEKTTTVYRKTPRAPPGTVLKSSTSKSTKKTLARSATKKVEIETPTSSLTRKAATNTLKEPVATVSKKDESKALEKATSSKRAVRRAPLKPTAGKVGSKPAPKITAVKSGGVTKRRK